MIDNINEKTNEYQVIVVGAGHAGCEAALAAARLGKRTLLLTISLDSIAHMPCNPSIGGTGKGQLVREIDALGGEMGILIDKTFIQSKMLNRAKGPAVHSPRAQADKQRYHVEMKKTLEKEPNLHLRQGEVVDLCFSDLDNSEVCGVLLKSGTVYNADAIILASGTYLGSRIFVSDRSFESGPSGFAASTELSATLTKRGFGLRRFKTGTPARVLGRSLNYEAMKEQPGDEMIAPFSFLNENVGENKVSCWLTYTNKKGHEIVAKNITKTAPYGGYTTGVGPRYCLSIEDKVDRFPERERHQLFLEPEGIDTDEVYIQGMSTSLPEKIQEDFYRTIPGLENAEFSRYAYSIEYDCIDPQELTLSLAHRRWKRLFCAGQINGTSGYEEAAAQGLMAGINASLWIDGKEPFVLERSDAYIGVLIDDLITKGTDEPYRIMTSRAEFRLILRQDNADLRLTGKGYEIGLASKERYDKFIFSKEAAESEIARLNSTKISSEKANSLLSTLNSSEVQFSVSLAELLVRPEVTYKNLESIDEERSELPSSVQEQAEIQIKYSGYIEKQLKQIEKFKKLESKLLPTEIVYSELDGLRLEARQKLDRLKPKSLGQAARISGVSPADISVLMIYMAKEEAAKK